MIFIVRVMLSVWVMLSHPTVVRVIRPHQKESRKDQEPAGLSFSAK